MRWSNSSRGRQLLARGGQAALDLLGRVGRPRCDQALASASNDGGSMKIRTASGSASRTWRAPWTSISSTIPRAGRSSSLHSVP